MIDKLVLHIPFKSCYLKFFENEKAEGCFLPLEILPENIKFVAGSVTIGKYGLKEVEELRTKFESLPSSFSGMAFKIYEYGRNCDPFVMLKCSPAKLTQGHNLFGFDDIEFSGVNMLALMASVYPELFAMLDVPNTEVSEIDLAYSAFINDQEAKKMLLDYLRHTSKGQTKNHGDNYETSIYFGSKTSRLKKLKVYSKYEEMKNDVKNMKKKGFKESATIVESLLLSDRAKSSLRFEATLKKRFLERRKIPTNFIALCSYFKANRWAYTELFKDAWQDVFDALSGQEIKIMNEDNVYNALYSSYSKISVKTGRVSTVKVDRLFSLYQLMKIQGFEAIKNREMNRSRPTWYRNLKDLTGCGIALATLQNLKNDSNVVKMPIYKLIEIDFSNQVPKDYKMPGDLFVA